MQIGFRWRGLLATATTLMLAPLAESGAETWSFDISTDGDDVEFVAPVGLSTGLAGYRMVYHVDQVYAMAILPAFPGWPLTFEVLDRLPPELRDGTKFLAGPPPLVLLEADARYPDDPNLVAGLQCHITFGMKADGRPFVSATDNILSIFETLLDPNDPGSSVTVELLSVQLIGTVSAEEAPAIQVVDSTAQVPEDGSVNVAVKLSMTPAADVVVTITSTGGDSDITCNAQSLTFSPGNWSEPQAVTFSAAADADGDAGQATFDFTADAAAPATVTVVEIEPDCDNNGIADRAEIVAGDKADCNENFLPDVCEIAAGLRDCNGNQIPDACELASGAGKDCDANGLLDACDMAGGAADCDANGVPDRCQPDRDGDGRVDACDGCPDDAQKTSPGQCGCDVPESACGNADSGGANANTNSSASSNANVNGSGSASSTAPDAPTAPGDGGLPPTDSSTTSEAPTSEPPPTGDAGADTRALEELLAERCGAGMCGIGVAGWLPATFLGLVGVRAARRRQ